ncbi:hypothetical protein LWI29_022185 [Acer saccharum]|uniref:DUF7036 domain-containing protein n=1 Tax=Acer saccharum TaxID=4024 RepID=A0AA39VRL9_ACESA|nr:hypothetical protein LWI29_022185 [Acer saccharum]
MGKGEQNLPQQQSHASSNPPFFSLRSSGSFLFTKLNLGLMQMIQLNSVPQFRHTSDCISQFHSFYYIERLEYDIYEEISVPNTKVAILSMHRLGVSNWTGWFEILKFPGGITVIPMQSVSIWQISQILFNFTLNNSTSRIVENFVELRDQLKYGLHLRTYENVYVQVTNTFGSTIFSPVTVQASVMSDLGGLLPQRLKQLAETITDSPAENLGLDNLVFGKVKGVILSSYLKHTLHATPPTPSPSPTPEPSISPYPALSPTYSPAPSPNIHHLPPCFGSEAPSPSDHNNLYSPSRKTVPPSSSPGPHPNPTHSTPMGPPKSALDLSPLPEVSCGSTPDNDVGSATSPVSPSLAPSPSSLAVGLLSREIWLLGFSGLLIFHFLCRSD